MSWSGASDKVDLEMKSITDHYKEAGVIVTTGHNPDLNSVPVPAYTDEEHETWELMYQRQRKLLPERASQENITALKLIDLPGRCIPTLKECDAKLKPTGWGVTRVEGLVPEKEFFECLAQKLFPCTDFIRKREEIEYTPSPDMFHDMFGHLPLITNQTFADFYEYFGKVALKANETQLEALQRIYWFTVEFGLIRNPEGIRIYGAGILSSVGEVEYCLTDKTRKHAMDFDRMANTSYEIDHMQDDLFVVESFEQLLEGFKTWAKSKGLR